MDSDQRVNTNSSATTFQDFSIVEASISQLRSALDQGLTSSVDLVSRYLQRIAKYDRYGPDRINSIPLLNPSVFKDAAASDDRRAAGKSGPLEGIPFTVKDSYMVKGMTCASGSPAFKDLVASDDAFTVKALRDAGAVLIGRTNMPPMAAGGMQRGCYGRAESPYNSSYLPAAFASGSSNGSGSSTAASFAAFGMAEETVSSGRSPASNNGLVAYTPSRGLISIRGNWPLYPTCDVIVPHTRTMTDLFEILDIIVKEDEITTGDFWRNQPFITLPSPHSIRPKTFKSIANADTLNGKRIGVPKMYIGDSSEVNTPITIRPSIIALYHQAKATLESLGAEVVETEFPFMALHDSISAIYDPVNEMQEHRPTPVEDGLTKEWNSMERRELVAYSWDDFLKNNGDEKCKTLADVNDRQIFPKPAGALPDRYIKLGAPVPYSDLIALITPGRPGVNSLPGISAALHALENRRKVDFEDWLEREGFDAICFPANGDVGPANADKDDRGADLAWKNGAMYSNGNRVLRHFGIPSITVPMGVMEDTEMPVGLTFAGRAYKDSDLLGFAASFEQVRKGRSAPKRTPELKGDRISEGKMGGGRPDIKIDNHTVTKFDNKAVVNLSGAITAGEGDDITTFTVFVNGQEQEVEIEGKSWKLSTVVSNIATTGEEIDKIMVVLVAAKRGVRCSGELVLL